MAATLERTTFEISREVEYFTESELDMQIGFGMEQWPIALLKELIDNALDSCESAGVPPIVTVTVEDDSFSVQDNGPGLPEATLTGSLDYMKRVSDKLFYASPTRGRLGNALKVMWAAPYVADGKQGLVEVWTGGRRHTVTVTLDRIAGRPVIDHAAEEDPLVRNGTFTKVHWANSTGLLGEDGRVHSYKLVSPPTAAELVQNYAAFNPHATFEFQSTDEEEPPGHHVATAPDWKKWRACDPTPPAWYTPGALRDLMAAYISNPAYQARPKTVRAFVSEFKGLSSTAKQKLVAGQWAGSHLHDLVADEDLDMSAVGELLERMQANAKAPKPRALGVIGEEHVRAWMVADGADPEAIQYVKSQGEGDDGLPYVFEFGFGPRMDEETGRRLVVGLNWSAALENPISELSSLLQKQRVDGHDPVIVFAHVAKPLLRFTDRAKSQVAL